MSADISAVAADVFLKGAFDVLDAMTSRTFSIATEPAVAADAEYFAATLPEYRLVLQGRLKTGGPVAVLLPAPAAARLAALIEGKEDEAASADEDAVLAVLREVADPFLGAGATALLEKAGHTPEQPEEVTAELAAPDAAETLLAFFSNSPKSIPFTFSAVPFEGTGRLLITDEAEQLMPAEEVNGEADSPAETPPAPNLSDGEVSEILSGFDKDEKPAAAAPAAERTVETAAAAQQAKTPSNLEMVLDIRLAATARLGRVEMPIGDILNLGPGSIIDVGRLVDEPVELLVNNKLIARGDVVVVDEKFGLRITEIISPKERIESLQ